MKTSLITLLLLIVLFTEAQSVGDTYAKAQQQKSATIILAYNGVYGFVEKNSEGEVSGLLIALMKRFEEYVKEEKGITVNHKFLSIEDGSFPRLLTEIKGSSGGVFGLSNVSITEDRKKVYAMSVPFLDNVSILVSHASVPTLASREEIKTKFSNLTAYTAQASTYEDRLREIKRDYIPDLKISYEISGDEVMKKVANDPNSFAVLDLNYYLEILNNRYSIKRHPVFDRRDDQFGIIMPKDNDWAPLLNEFLNSGFLQSEEYNKIISDNLGTSARRLIESISTQ